MASLSEIARGRKSQLRQLMLASRKLDAAQEALEREVKRLTVRKQSVPELADAQRLVQLAKVVESALSSMVSVIGDVASSWASV